MPIHSKNKGKRGELEASKELTKGGFPATRGQQFKGTEDSPDIDCPSLPDYHFEVKFIERFQLYPSLEQAQNDAPNKVPVVLHRKKRKDWIAILPLTDFLELLKQSKKTDSKETASND